MKLQDFFATHPVFTYGEFVEFLSIQGSRNVKTRESILSHYTKTGRLLRVRRGLYLSVPQGLTPEKCPVDPYLLASRMAPDSVLAYHTALELHGKAYSVYEEFVYLTRSRSRPLNFRGQKYRGVAFPKKLKDKDQESFGVVSLERSGLDVRVTSLERTLVDVLDRPALGGTWEEIWRSLELVEFFDLDKVVEYTIHLENATTVAKVGFFLEQHKDTLMPNEGHLNRLRSLIPVQPHYMVRNGRKAGRFVRGWNLVVPPEIVERRWEEQH
ncbi:MAG: transcriptional regulator [Deltaproteobacteria bacterium]|nr:transcriptional regulator [Deltaproteobacteria bacterium]MBW2020857.1 transcriptional regulator [Deltaproteobacteria bacterium]MBW2075296.1 transcriptional regulator [Deltaproteobacteria bacterium]RLB82017.1 MAG: transcriptional regulator [Deltaproteobacteria bacterium]